MEGHARYSLKVVLNLIYLPQLWLGRRIPKKGIAIFKNLIGKHTSVTNNHPRKNHYHLCVSGSLHYYRNIGMRCYVRTSPAPNYLASFAESDSNLTMKIQTSHMTQGEHCSNLIRWKENSRLSRNNRDVLWKKNPGDLTERVEADVSYSIGGHITGGEYATVVKPLTHSHTMEVKWSLNCFD